jgi:hypothetical protein
MHDALVGALMTRQADGENGSSPGRRRQERPRVSVVIPALNEEPNLPFVLPKIDSGSTRSSWSTVVRRMQSTPWHALCCPGSDSSKQSGHGKAQR